VFKDYLSQSIQIERQRVVEMIETNKKEIAWLAGKDYRNSTQVVVDVLEKISDLQSKLDK
jgi:predicted nucleotide-binding protein (sugar kinase/HSP70/actin superfamily)